MPKTNNMPNISQLIKTTKEIKNIAVIYTEVLPKKETLNKL